MSFFLLRQLGKFREQRVRRCQKVMMPNPPSPDAPERIRSVVLPQKVSELRRKLGQKAKQETNFRFYALYDRIYRLDVLMVAWQIVAQKDGFPGVDGVSCRDIIDGPV